MIILGVETSCDETAASVVEDGKKVLSNVISSSLPSHSQTGGIIPETAAREQSSAIIAVIDLALKEAPGKNSAFAGKDSLDALAVTFGPGLFGSLLVGVEAVKTLCYSWSKPIVPINHLIGHLYASWLENDTPPKFPLVALIVSGGHTELLYVKNHDIITHIGGTRDDAAGEAFDKIARILNLGYPGGPAIEKAAKNGDPRRFLLPRPMFNSPDFDFSFSGLKTAVVNTVNAVPEKDRRLNQFVADMAACVQETIADVLVKKTLKAANKCGVKTLVIGGGVTANKRLKERLQNEFHGAVHVPSPEYAVDNGAMIAAAAFFNYHPKNFREVRADASILF